MDKFRYYIVDLHMGIVKGTNNPQIVERFTRNANFIVIATETDKVVFAGMPARAIEEIN